MNGIATNFTDLLEDDPEVLPLWGARTECSWHIFPCEEAGSNKTSCSPSVYICRSHLLYNADLFHKQAGTGPRETGTGSRHAEILARAAPADNIHRGQLGPVQLGDIPHMDHAGEVFLGHADRERLDLAGPDGSDSIAHRRQRKAADPVKQGAHGQHSAMEGPGGCSGPSSQHSSSGGR